MTTMGEFHHKFFYFLFTHDCTYNFFVFAHFTRGMIPFAQKYFSFFSFTNLRQTIAKRRAKNLWWNPSMNQTTISLGASHVLIPLRSGTAPQSSLHSSMDTAETAHFFHSQLKSNRHKITCGSSKTLLYRVIHSSLDIWHPPFLLTGWINLDADAFWMGERGHWLVCFKV